MREHGEYEAGHVKGAHLVPRGIIEAAAAPAYRKHLPEMAAARVPQVVYCATSGRSAMAAAVRLMMGFRNVLNMEGGSARQEAGGMPQEHEAGY